MLNQDDPIKHIVLLIMENHSFDQMLGCFQSIYPDLEGIDFNAPSRFNLDAKGNKIFQKETTEKQVTLDPYHYLPNVLTQLNENNSGFVKDYLSIYPKCTIEECEYVMGYYPLGFLPGLHSLGKEFIICDHWFSSLPGPTWPNRFFALSGTSSGRVKMPEGIFHPDLDNLIFDQNQTTLFDRLNEAKKTWKIYYYDFPLSLVLTHQRRPENLAHYYTIDNFFKDARGLEKNFPEFTFIEPQYLGVGQNDDHPPHNIMKAEKLIADVYNAIRSNKSLWESTLLVIFYDEHGGFYDHVVPPKSISPDDHKEEYTFDQLGVRVPALLISPWVDNRVEKTVFDHTSLLKYLIDKWQLNSLGNRAASANSIATALRFDRSARQDTIPFIRVPNVELISENMELEKWDTNLNHEAIYLFTRFLSKKMNIDAKSLEKIYSIARLKKNIGSFFIKIGKWLQQDLEADKKIQIQTVSDIISKLMKK